MASAKPDLSRAGTMQVTSKDGQSFLDRNLTEWKKPYLMDHYEEDGESGDQDEEEAAPPAAKSKMSKHTTMKGTAKDAEAFLEGAGRPDEDTLTRGQQKQLEEIMTPPTKKARMARDNTMAATAKEGKALLEADKMKKNKRTSANMKRVSTITKAVAEAKAVFGDLDTTEGRKLRKRPEAPKAPKSAMKRAGTMQATAKEGKAYLKRGKKSGKKSAKKE